MSRHAASRGQPDPEVRLGTRGSTLARRQTQHVAALLAAAWPQHRFVEHVFSTAGDRQLDQPLHAIGGKGLFTAELEQALRAGDIDCAVHSLKDLPVEQPEGLVIGAVPPRESWRDMLVYRLPAISDLSELPTGARVGTSSIRRAAQLLLRRPDLRIVDLRGNVETRLRKLRDPSGPYDAIVMAEAAIDRLGLWESEHLAGLLTLALPAEQMLPAPGQGALAVQCRAVSTARSLVAPIDDPGTAAEVTAERAFLAGLGGGCSAPVAALGLVGVDGLLRLTGRVCATDGSRSVDVELATTLPSLESPRGWSTPTGPDDVKAAARQQMLAAAHPDMLAAAQRETLAAAEAAGKRLAADALANGAAALVEA